MKKQFIVTGSSRGIGYELVKKLLSEGHKVIALSRNIIPFQSLDNKNLNFISIDFENKKSLEQVIDFIKTKSILIDGVVHNAGRLIKKPFNEILLEDFEATYQVNVFAVAMLTKALIPFMNKNSHMVAISSMGGIQGSLKFAELAAYSSSKGALITLIEVLAEAYKDQNISFNSLALGAVQTAMLKDAFPEYEAPTTAQEMANYISNFVQNGHLIINGKTIQVSKSTP